MPSQVRRTGAAGRRAEAGCTASGRHGSAGGGAPSSAGAGTSGTYSFLFTDIEGSTRHLMELGDGFVNVLEDHHRILRAAISAHAGEELSTEGDAFFVSFRNAWDAVSAAVTAQRALRWHPWPGAPVKVRMGIHTGSALVGPTGFVGMTLHQTARICASAHGGQVVISRATRDQLGPALVTDLKPLGRHRLKDIGEPQALFQVCHPELEESFGPLRTLGSDADGLPTPPTKVVGRAEDVVSLSRILLSDQTRIVTLSGPGGVGKTTLATEVARSCADHFEDGVFFVALAPFQRSELVPAAISAALGLRDEAGRLTDLEEVLRRRRALLVLDNFEHVMSAAAFVARLAVSCPRLVVLVTSREVLRIRGERTYEVATLAAPEAGRRSSPDELRSFPAMRLFEARASDVVRDFEITAGNAELVAGICRAVDGLPLAIELAAARMRLLSPEALVERLGDRLGLLQGGGPDRPERHQTLRGAVQWSYELLAPEEQRMFRQLSVFAGGSLADGVAAVYPGNGDVLDTLESLLDKSLIRRIGERGDRFTMLETVRHYAAEMLSHHGEDGGARRHHADHFSRLAEQAEPALTSAARDSWLRRLRLEHDNLRSALTWLDDHDVEAALRLAANLSWFWYHGGHFREGRHWLERAETATDVSPRVRGRALLGAARLVGYGGDEGAARRVIDEAVGLIRAHDDARHLGYALQFAGVVFMEVDPAMSSSALAEAVAIFRGLDDPWGLALAVCYHGINSFQSGDEPRMERALDESSLLFERLGDTWGLAGAILYRGLYHHRRGDLEGASRLLEQCEILVRHSGDRWRLVAVLEKLAAVRVQQGQDPAPLVEELDLLCEAMGLPPRPVSDGTG